MVNNEQIRALVREIEPALIEIRHQLHRHPELSNQEFHTAGRIEETLRRWGVEYRRNDSTAVLGLIHGSRPGPTVGLRADIDALPIEEQSGVPFSSCEAGAMHACGHDLHTTILLGVAYVLSRNNDFAGTVKLCFQPAEEVGGGVEALQALGLLEAPVPEAFLALHVHPDTPVGTLHVKPGAMMCASSGFRVAFTGSGGHASQPHQTEDTVLSAAKFITDAQIVTSRLINQAEPLTITVSTIHGGQAGRANIIPKRVDLEGTIRTPKRETHAAIHEDLRRIIRAIELTTGVKGEITFRNGSDAVMNDPRLTELFLKGAAELLGAENVSVTPAPYMGSDNFARYGKFAPSVYFSLGIQKPDAETVHGLHSPFFTADDAAIRTGTAALTRGALDFLSHLEV